MSSKSLPIPRASRCHVCGATSYARVVERAQGGPMVAGNALRCSGCAKVFADLRAWRHGPGDGRESPVA